MAQMDRGETGSAWELFQRVQRDEGTSYYLKSALQQLVRRDPVDALRDAEIMHEFCRKQLDEIQGAAIAARQGKLAIVPAIREDGTRAAGSDIRGHSALCAIYRRKAGEFAGECTCGAAE